MAEALMATMNSFRTYSDGRPKVPHLGSFCANPTVSGVKDPDYGHRVCGGWWCTCSCHDSWDIGQRSTIGEHAEHEWKQVEDCVYCTCDPTVRLYQGQVCTDPAERQALGAYFDAVHAKTDEEWRHMRAEVMKAREPTTSAPPATPVTDSPQGQL